MGREPLPEGTWGKIGFVELPDGRFRARARVRDSDGWTREVTRISTSRTAAEKKLKAALKARTAPVQGSIKDTTRLTDVWKEYSRVLLKEVEAEQKGPQTLRRYREIWSGYLEDRVGGWRVREARPEKIILLLEEIRDAYSPSTTRLVRSVFSQVLQLAYNRGALETNPLVGKGIRVLGGPEKPKVSLTQEQVQKLIAKLATDEKAAKHDLPDLIMWMVMMGERIGGALALHWPWIDWEAETVRIGPNIIRDNNGKLMVNERNVHKVNIRTVGVPKPAMRMLRLRWGQKSALGAKWNPIGPVFPNGRGKLRQSSEVHRVLRPSLDQAGFEWLVPHTMRKTAASTLANTPGMTMDQVAAILGHRSVKTTRQYYASIESVNPMGVASLSALIDNDDGEDGTVLHGNFG